MLTPSPYRHRLCSMFLQALLLGLLVMLGACSSTPARPHESDLDATKDPPPIWPAHQSDGQPPPDENNRVIQDYLEQLNKIEVHTPPKVSSSEQPGPTKHPSHAVETFISKPTNPNISNQARDNPIQVNTPIPPLKSAIHEAQQKQLENPNDTSLTKTLLHLYLAEDSPDSIEKADKLSQQLQTNSDISALVLKFLILKRIGAEDAAASLINEIAGEVRNTMPLRIADAALCRVIRGYGDYEKFPSYSFTPGSRFAIYIQPENFSCKKEHGSDMYRITLQVDFELLTHTGDKIPWPSWNSRHGRYEKRSNVRVNDLFLSVVLDLPENMTVGDYIIKITLKDSSPDKKPAEREIPISIR